ncbi:ABC transporter substrate-binding protein, partial [Candidatus Bathyarchaeota archaeon]|nr:ABC transporter substrate-binding protein [Candidatus Bathyarchaeota archaeon]
ENIQTTLNVPVVCVRFNPPGTRDWSYDIISIIGAVVGKKEKAEQLKTYLEQKLSEVTSITSTIPDSEKPKVYVTMVDDPLTTLTWSSEVDYAGGINVAKSMNATRPWMKVSLEQVIRWNPDIIIIPGVCIPRREGINPEDLLNNPDWQAIKAVKNGKVYRVTWLGFFGFDPAGTVISTFQRAKLFHPNLFRNLDVEREGNEIFKAVYGVDGLYTELKKESGASI